jgi:hypothetical protein
MRVRFARSAGGLALLALLAGCGTASTKGGAFHPNGGSDSTLPASENPATVPSPTAIAPTAMTTPQFTKSVLDAYRAYQKAYERSYETASPAALDAVATNPALASLTKRVQRIAAKRLVYRFTMLFNPKIQTWQPDRTVAVVADCVVTTSWYSFSITTGKRVASGKRSNPVLYRFAMRYDSGSQTWKVYAIEGGAKCR